MIRSKSDEVRYRKKHEHIIHRYTTCCIFLNHTTFQIIDIYIKTPNDGYYRNLGQDYTGYDLL